MRKINEIEIPHTLRMRKDQLEQKFLYWTSNDYIE